MVLSVKYHSTQAAACTCSSETKFVTLVIRHTLRCSLLYGTFSKATAGRWYVVSFITCFIVHQVSGTKNSLNREKPSCLHIIGVSLSELHTSGTALQTRMCVSVRLLAAKYRINALTILQSF